MRPSQPRRASLRAQRSQEPGEAIAARVAALRPFLGRDLAERRARLARLLRAERRAAHSGQGYDATRHAALRRLEAEMAADIRKIGTRLGAPPAAGSRITDLRRHVDRKAPAATSAETGSAASSIPASQRSPRGHRARDGG
ncbi:hypothetical protein KHC28_26455 [Ancylobacter sonchi]|uniref:hypothetical protein n=1 Tax=Ancylobacter sonchi TaxID=1937790 RepID=UPI001BD27959|nr:hypothetical protein [Ancylobacter sonchi]MBS7537194.1 hypothetical protein [Ancylobacter sonchi]